MKYYLKLIVFLFITIVFTNINAQSPIGSWITKDDETGEQQAIVRIYKSNNQLIGVIDKLLVKSPTNTCTYCKGSRKNKPFLGMIVITEMKKKGNEWNGKVYKADMGMEFKGALKMINNNTLRVTGKYLFITRHQFWKRLK